MDFVLFPCDFLIRKITDSSSNNTVSSRSYNGIRKFLIDVFNVSGDKNPDFKLVSAESLAVLEVFSPRGIIYRQRACYFIDIADDAGPVFTELTIEPEVMPLESVAFPGFMMYLASLFLAREKIVFHSERIAFHTERIAFLSERIVPY